MSWRLGVDIRATPLSWDAFWQTLPLEALRQDLLGSVLSLHAQPPLHNLLVGLIAKFSEQPLAWLQGLYALLGAGLCALASALIASATGSARLGIGVGCLLALSPNLLLYEAYPLYTLPTAFFLALALLEDRCTQDNGLLFSSTNNRELVQRGWNRKLFAVIFAR